MTRSRFTLVELLAAVAITAIVVPVTISAMLTAARVGETARMHNEAAALADMKLRELVATDDWREAADRGDFGDDYPTFAWTLETDEWTDVDTTMRQLSLTVYSLNRPDDPGVTLVTLVSDEESE